MTQRQQLVYEILCDIDTLLGADGRSLHATPKESYEESLKAEEARERDYRRTLQGGFESEFASLDALQDKTNGKSFTWSDGGRGAFKVRHFPLFGKKATEFVAKVEAAKERKRRYNWARNKVIRLAPQALPTFQALVKFNGNRRDAIEWLLYH